MLGSIVKVGELPAQNLKCFLQVGSGKQIVNFRRVEFWQKVGNSEIPFDHFKCRPPSRLTVHFCMQRCLPSLSRGYSFVRKLEHHGQYTVKAFDRVHNGVFRVQVDMVTKSPTNNGSTWRANGLLVFQLLLARAATFFHDLPNKSRTN